MTPEKTGAQIYLREYDKYYIGDLYSVGELYIVKCNPSFSTKPIRENLNLSVSKVLELWEERHSIVICHQYHAIYYGYEGMRIKEAFL